MLVSVEQEARLGAQAYEQVLSKEKISDDEHMTAVLNRVGKRIAAVANRPNFAWEFKLIESDQVNAFCLPGGKIAVYTGILPIMKNEAGMAIVIGHEVAHATARHGAERMSQHLTAAVVQEAIGVGLQDASKETRDAALAAFGAGAKVGVLLPYSRTHELEADQLGLILAAKAGYDPREAVPLWQRMAKAAKNKPPEFLSTHPHEEHRIERLRELMEDAMEEYQDAKHQHGLGEPL
jgi:predicted Zn-dependent protease